MSKVLEYSGIVAKVRSMRSKLVTDSQYEEIAGLSSYKDLVPYLKHLPAYAPVFQSIDETKLHRGDIEKLLRLSVLNDYSKLYRFAGVEQRKYLKLYIRNFETEYLKTCCRLIFNHLIEPFGDELQEPSLSYNSQKNTEYDLWLSEMQQFFDHYTQLHIDRLMTSTSMREFADNLSGTEYQPLFRKLEASGRTSLFDYELELDLFNFQSAWAQGRKSLRLSEYQLFIKEYGERIDLLNLTYIYRSKKYFNMNSADIYSMLIPIHHFLNQNEIHLLAEASDTDDFMNRLSRTYYGKRYTDFSSYTLETIYSKCLYSLYKSMWLSNPYSMAAVNTYLFLKEEEVHKIIILLECIRYGFDRGKSLQIARGEVTK